MYVYKREWEDDPEIGNKTRQDPNDISKGLCNICNKQLCAQLSVLKKYLRRHNVDNVNIDNINVAPQAQQGDNERLAYKYQESWETNPHYSDWVRRVDADSTKAFCTVCNKEIVILSSSLEQHMRTYLHFRNQMIAAGNPTGEYLHKNPRFDMELAQRELQMTAFIVQQNYSFKSMNNFTPFIKSMSPESEINQKMNVGPQKAQALAIKVIAPIQQQRLEQTLRKTKFSILVDEMTDIAVDKCLGIVVQYWSIEDNDCVYFLSNMIPVYTREEMETVVNAEHLFKLIKVSFEKHKIPSSNIIAFSSDTASVMMGRNNSVASRLKEYVPGIVVLN